MRSSPGHLNKMFIKQGFLDHYNRTFRLDHLSLLNAKVIYVNFMYSQFGRILTKRKLHITNVIFFIISSLALNHILNRSKKDVFGTLIL